MYYFALVSCADRAQFEANVALNLKTATPE